MLFMIMNCAIYAGHSKLHFILPPAIKLFHLNSKYIYIYGYKWMKIWNTLHMWHDWIDRVIWNSCTKLINADLYKRYNMKREQCLKSKSIFIWPFCFGNFDHSIGSSYELHTSIDLRPISSIDEMLLAMIHRINECHRTIDYISQRNRINYEFSGRSRTWALISHFPITIVTRLEWFLNI